MCACVISYHAITLNTLTLRVTIIKGKFDLKLNSKGSRGPYSGYRANNFSMENGSAIRGSKDLNATFKDILIIGLLLNDSMLCKPKETLYQS